MKIKVIYIIAIISVLPFLTIEGTEYSKNIFSLGVNYGLNYHFADFKSLPGIPNSSPGFKSGLGLSPNFYVGYERKLGVNLFGLPTRYNMKLGFNILDADLIEKEFIGYDIEGDLIREINIEHRIFSDVKEIAIENNILFNFLEDNLSVGGGLGFGYLLISDFQQEEFLMLDDRFFENGTQKRNVYQGEIPECSKVQLYATINSKYKIYNVKDFDFYANLSAKYYMTEVFKGSHWTFSRIEGGISVAYNKKLEKEKPIPPLKPALPDLPNPEPPDKPEPINLTLDIKNQGQFINKEDSVYLVKKTNVYQTEYEVPSVFFYQQNGTEPINENYKLMLASLADTFKKDKIELLIYEIADAEFAENKKNVEKRAEDLKQLLIEFGFDENKISLSNYIKKGKLQYPTLYEEFYKIEIKVNKEIPTLTFNVNSITESKIISDSVYFNIKANPNAVITTLKGVVSNNNHNIFDYLKMGENGFDIYRDLSSKSEKKSETISVKLTAADNKEQTESIEKSFYITFKNDTIFYKDNKPDTEIFYYAFSEFDKSSFYSVNKKAKEIIANAKNENKLIVLTASTDEFGTNEYNDVLAKKRMAKALKDLDLENYQNISLKYKINNGNKNSNYQRTFNRSVFFEIR